MYWLSKKFFLEVRAKVADENFIGSLKKRSGSEKSESGSAVQKCGCTKKEQEEGDWSGFYSKI